MCTVLLGFFKRNNNNNNNLNIEIDVHIKSKLIFGVAFYRL